MALIPPYFFDCVVALGVQDEKGDTQWTASGFLYGDFLAKIDEERNRYRVYLVTNRHVVAGEDHLLVRFNRTEGTSAREFNVALKPRDGKDMCHLHPDEEIDLAVVRIDADVLNEHDIRFEYFHSDSSVSSKTSLEEYGASEGDEGYVLGFPMGLVGGERSFVIARGATIARVRDYLAGVSKEILVDCLIFPGNSGGPFVTRPEISAITGTKSHGSAALVGVVSSYIPYQDVAVSVQTKRPRVIFEENSGLVSVVPAQYLIDLIGSLRPEGEEAAPDEPEVTLEGE